MHESLKKIICLRSTHRIGLLVMVSLCLGFILTNVSASSEAVQSKKIEPWTILHFPAANVELAFPKPPKHEVTTFSLPDLKAPLPEGIFTAQNSDDALYIASLIEFGDEKPADLIDRQLRRLVSLNANNQLIKNASVETKKGQAQNFLIQNLSDSSYRQGRIILQGQNLYTLMVAYSNGRFPADDYARFIQSLKFLQ